MRKQKGKLWDKEIGSLIRNRKIANRLYRQWTKSGIASPDVLHDLWDEYIKIKRQVHEKIKTKKVEQKVKVIVQNSRKGSKNTRAYWRMLRRLNGNNSYPLRIFDPNNSSRIIEDPKEINKVLGEYWRNLGGQPINNDYDKQVQDLHNGDTDVSYAVFVICIF